MAGATFPDDVALGDCVLVPMRRGLVPFVAGALRMYEAKSYWATRDDYERAYNAFVELQMAMLNNCLTQLVEGQDRLYRLWDTALNGTQYAETEPGIITPPIPAVPDASTSAPNALRAQVGRMSHIMENAATGATFSEGAGIEGAPALPEELSWSARLLAVQGETPGGIFGIGAKPVQFLDLLKAGRINDQSDKDKLKSAIDQVDSALDVGTDLGTFIKSFLDSAAELGTDGGAIATQLVIGAATNRALQRLIFSLDGGNPIRPGDNVLRALRGDVEATADRNVIDAIGAPWVDPAGEQTPYALLASINSRLETLRATLRGPTTGPTIDDRLIAIGRQLGGLVSLNDANEAQAGAVFQVVANLLGCICEAVSGEPTPAPEPQFPPQCDFPATVYKAQSVTDQGETTGGDPPPSRMYSFSFNWDAEDAVGPAQVGPNGGFTYPIIGDPGQEFQLCFAWDFTGADRPKLVGFDVSNVIANADDILWSPNPEVSEVGAGSATLIIGTDPGQVAFITPKMEFEEGKAPSLNFWVKVRRL